jgi:hypothetical protein
MSTISHSLNVACSGKALTRTIVCLRDRPNENKNNFQNDSREEERDRQRAFFDEDFLFWWDDDVRTRYRVNKQ